MSTVLEAPPQPKRGLGCCLGKGCLILVILLLFLAVAGVFGLYIGTRRTFTSTEPRQLPQVETSDAQQQEVRQRWKQFENQVRNNEPPPPLPDSSPSATTPPPVPTPAATNPTIEFSANDINQLIAANRKARGKAFVSITNGVGEVSVSIPLKKLGFTGRYLNADFEVRSSSDGNPAGIQITTKAQSGIQVPERIFNFLVSIGRVRSYVDRYVNEYRNEYQVSSFRIVADKVVIEAGRRY